MITWDEQDAVELREFLHRNPKFMLCLQQARPKCKGSTMEERAVTGSDVKGFDDALDAINDMRNMTTPPKEKSPFIS